MMKSGGVNSINFEKFKNQQRSQKTMIDNFHPENAIDVEQITKNIVTNLTGNPEKMAQIGGDTNKIQNIVSLQSH